MFSSFEDWVDAARSTDILAEAERLGARLKRSGTEMVGPCPACGGVDRFGINERKRVFNCGHDGGAGGDVIAMVGHILDLDPKDGRGFLAICEAINGEPAPGRDLAETEDERRARELRLVERERAAEADRERREKAAESYRSDEIKRALAIWQEGRPILGTPGAAYLEARGIRHLAGIRLRFVDSIGYFVKPEKSKGMIKVCDLHGLVGGIVETPSGDFSGAHITHLDPVEPRKACIAHPETGELQPAKKIRGSVHGAVIRLAGPVAPRRLVCGEGIETVLSVRDEMIDAGRDLSDVAFWAGISLGNMGGAATETVAHPLGLTKTDAAGRVRTVKIPGPIPDLSRPGIALPATVEDALILGDGDSDKAVTEFATRRCAARWAAPGRTVRRAWARVGGDFNDMRREPHSGGAAAIEAGDD